MRSGNLMIFDPVTYYSDRETDIAMTESFGRFSNNLYTAYCEEYPLDPNYKVRRNFIILITYLIILIYLAKGILIEPN